MNPFAIFSILRASWVWILMGLLVAAVGIQQLRIDHYETAIAERKATDAESQRLTAQARAKAEANAREKEHAWQENADNLGATKDEQIRTIGSKLATALASLRNRPSRPAGGVVPTSPSNCPAVTGTGLYREDGQFLAGEAAAAARIAAERDYYYERYNALLQPGQ